MDAVTLHKKLSTYVSEKGQLRNVSEEVLFEVITAWEEWQGTAGSFYKEIGFSYRQMASLLGKAKKLKREGYFGDSSFKELKVAAENHVHTSSSPGQLIEICWEGGKVIRFPHVDQLLEFIKKAS